MFKPIQDFLPKTANKWGIGHEYQAIQVCKCAENILKEIFSFHEQPKITAKSFKAGKLTLEAVSSSWNQEIAMRKDKIVDKLNAKFGKRVVKDLRTCLKP